MAVCITTSSSVSKEVIHLPDISVCRNIMMHMNCRALFPGSISEVCWFTVQNATLEEICLVSYYLVVLVICCIILSPEVEW